MNILESFAKVSVFVVGDVMVDKYLTGEVTRISPEAPVPVVRLKETSYIAGGAANVAANIAGLGGKTILAGVIGDDEEGEILERILIEKRVSPDHLLKITQRQTTLKTRVMAHHQQIVRIDREETEPLSRESEEKYWEKLKKNVDRTDIILISDYGKGFMSRDFTERLIMYGNKLNKKIVIDPKGNDYAKYRGATILTPNKHEVAVVCRVKEREDELLKAGKKLLKALNLQALLITRGEEGMTLLQKYQKKAHLDAKARHVYDVTGAGDTVIAALTLALGAGLSYREAAHIANTSAGLVVEEVGTSIISSEKLKLSLGLG